MNEAQEYARDNLSIKALDKDTIKATPGNGRRVHRLMLSARKGAEVEDLYHDYMSQPKNTRAMEPLVFASYWMKKANLNHTSLDSCWAEMTAAALKHEREFGLQDFQSKVINEAGRIQPWLWPE